MLRSEFNGWLEWAAMEIGTEVPSCNDDDYRLIEHVYNCHPIFDRTPRSKTIAAALLYVIGGSELYADLDRAVTEKLKGEEINEKLGKE